MNAMSSIPITLINPNTIVLRSDMFTTGIVYMPVSLAHFAGALRAAGYAPQVIDAFGEAPNQCWNEEQFLIRGLTPQEVLAQVNPDTSAFFLYAINLTYHRSLVTLCKALRAKYPDKPIIILENTQAVTAYSLRKVQEEFYQAGATFVLTGEGEERGLELLKALQAGGDREVISKIDGIGFRKADGQTHYTSPARKIANLDALPFPAWDLFPLKNYWQLHYAHGPLSANKYLPLLTSRGCPYKCRFCVIPETNDVKWRSRSPAHVVDEIEHHINLFGVTEFHIEDVDPTVNDRRTRELCQEILRRNLKITWKICSGTKVETMKDEATVELMAKAGCRYISISPESGSPKVMKLMNKSFDFDHAVNLVRKMNEVGIKSQACFVLGFPGEEDEDRQMTRDMVKRMTQVGLDEIALFIVTPVPGSNIYGELGGYEDYSQLNFSPTWRQDYEKLNQFRLKLYRSFLMWKVQFHPARIAKQPFNFLFRRFETKMEMVPYRAMHTAMISRRTLAAPAAN